MGFDSNTQGEFDELHSIENALRESIVEQKYEGKAETISVYFRLLNSARWFSINGEELYSPASLLKIPVMMAYFKQAEEDPTVLQKRFYDDGTYSFDEQDTIPADRKLKNGRSYAVEDLIERMILDSNNEAKDILEANLPKDYLSQIYEKLHVKDPYENSGDFIMVAEFPFFLRVLYNSTYLNQSYSEKALALLTRSRFEEGIPARLPPEVNVAHKFGFRLEESGLRMLELHDCGIVYYPEHPYTICVMTKGHAYDPLVSVLQDLSLLTYRAVEDFFATE